MAWPDLESGTVNLAAAPASCADRHFAIAGLFTEDFASPPAPSPEPAKVTSGEPESPPPPPLTEADVAAAREEGFVAGRHMATCEFEAAGAQMREQLLTRIAERLQEARRVAVEEAERNATALARLLMGTLGTMLPAIMAQCGGAEASALARTLLPRLTAEPRVTIAVHPSAKRLLAEDLARLAREVRGHIELVGEEDVAQGDIRIAWPEGKATCDGRAVWSAVAETLAPLGLLDTGDAAFAEAEGGQHV